MWLYELSPLCCSVPLYPLLEQKNHVFLKYLGASWKPLKGSKSLVYTHFILAAAIFSMHWHTLSRVVEFRSPHFPPL
jgi:hypothetical protein